MIFEAVTAVKPAGGAATQDIVLATGGAMILTTSIEWNDRPSSNCHLGHSIKKRDTGRQEGAVAEKAVPSSIPLFDAEPLVASHRRHGPG